VLKVAVVLAALFELFALVVLVSFTPVEFTLFMFFGELLFAAALLLLVGAVLADLRAKQLLPWGPGQPRWPASTSPHLRMTSPDTHVAASSENQSVRT
jgi:hypothetical protein